jgi:hypothetical protein
MRSRTVSVLIGVLVAVPLAGCGDDGNDGADLEPYIAALAADFAEPDDENPPISEEQARCAAENAIGAVDEDVVTGVGTPEEFVAATEENLVALDLDDETLDTIAEEIVSCFGGTEFFVDLFASTGASDEQLDCLRESITEDEFVASLRADLAGETDDEFGTQIETCFEG